MSRLFIKTPLIESLPLSKIAGGQVFLKLEALQPSGSFKNRGIGELCKHYSTENNAKTFISSSGGNAGLAVAYSGRILNVPVKVVIPKTSSKLMLEKIKSENAEVITHGENWLEADGLARELATQPGYYYISPFDHPLIWSGHATMIHEIAEEGVKPDAVCLAVGGGGLFCGVIQGLHDMGWNDVPVFTAETEGAASFAKSVKAGKLVTLDNVNTIATSLGAPFVTEQALVWSKKHQVYPNVITDNQALEACLKFADDHRLMVEPACGAALSLIYSKVFETKGYNKIAVIVCGGNIVNRALMQDWKQKLGIEK